jgi:phospholipase C
MRRFALWLSAALLGGCAQTSVAPVNPQARVETAARKAVSSSAKIQHVVIIIQENRSFDDLFQAYPGADTVSSGLVSTGQAVPLVPVSLKSRYDIIHRLGEYLNSYDNGKMDGFDLQPIHGKTTLQYPQYGYVPASETALYFQMAQQYVLGDRMFASNLDASFVAHQYLIAGQANRAVNLPVGSWGCDGGPADTIPTLNDNRTIGPSVRACFDYPTLGDELDAKGLTWRFYAPMIGNRAYIWSAYQAVDHIRFGSDWAADVISPQTQILSDVPAGTLANVTWVVPSLPDSDHAGSGSAAGPQWVASVVNAIGQSQFWNSTAIFVVWDDWGGWYDHVPPPQLDYDGLGFRVPLLIISPYAKQGSVTHVQYEFGSILRFVEKNFGLATLAAADARANNPGSDAFQFARAPRPFASFAALKRPADFLRERPSARPPDDD